MMGNEGSQLSGLVLSDKAIEVTEGWALHSATATHGNYPKLCIFSGHKNSSKSNAVTLERAAKNLMLHRHPCILKYISSWSKNGTYYLATEEVMPLSQVIVTLTPLQICVGLHSIIRALIFLHEKAFSSHNNVCCSSIYVTPDGSWKLGGLEFLSRFSDKDKSILQASRAKRYEKAVPPEEDSNNSVETIPTATDQFAYGVLGEEVLHKLPPDSIPALPEFREICRRLLQSSDISIRTPLPLVLDLPFFSHDFISIYNFLMELPIKSESDKEHFFRSLGSQLLTFPDKLVASQLGGLLLARMVLLDPTAQECLLPMVLQPMSGGHGLFSKELFKKFIIPRLLQMFCVRDAQIRLLLLAHFPYYCSLFTPVELKNHILPELLVGIKDTNDVLVSVTLRCLSDLVPLLGAATVIGGKRAKLFCDGRPTKCNQTVVGVAKHQKSTQERSPQFSEVENDYDLPERPSPDGGEDNVTTTTDEDTEAWSDWENQENISDPVHFSDNNEVETELSVSISEIPAAAHLPDITSLDVKNSISISPKRTNEEFNFFQDMEPVISKTQTMSVENIPNNSENSAIEVLTSTTEVSDVRNKFEVVMEADHEVEGWGEDLDCWTDNEHDSDNQK